MGFFYHTNYEFFVYSLLTYAHIKALTVVIYQTGRLFDIFILNTIQEKHK